ncbi:hypothetical protein Taro_000754, partial [Colocasia esculenta]|nr:hypothetical protein [Colocasia esculenta]
YVLGAVFLQLCQLLRLEEHPIVQKPVDPSLFIHRFAERLLGEKNSEVIKIALRIIASMKRDWMQAIFLLSYYSCNLYFVTLRYNFVLMLITCKYAMPFYGFIDGQKTQWTMWCCFIHCCSFTRSQIF